MLPIERRPLPSATVSIGQPSKASDAMVLRESGRIKLRMPPWMPNVPIKRKLQTACVRMCVWSRARVLGVGIQDAECLCVFLGFARAIAVVVAILRRFRTAGVEPRARRLCDLRMIGCLAGNTSESEA